MCITSHLPAYKSAPSIFNLNHYLHLYLLLQQHNTQPPLVAKLNSDHLRPLVDCLISCVEDSDVKIRDASAMSLAALFPIGKYAVESAYVHVVHCAMM